MIKKQIVYVFIDASNLWEAQKAKGKLFDYEKLKKYLEAEFETESMQVFYYTAYPADGTRRYSLEGRHKFFTYLKKALGFIVRKKPLKRIKVVTPEGVAIEEKGNMDVEITIDALHHQAKYNIAVFFTGDSDFLALVTYLRHGGKKVYIYSSKNNISQELLTGADRYRDILAVQNDIWRESLKYRSEKRSDTIN